MLVVGCGRIGVEIRALDPGRREPVADAGPAADGGELPGSRPARDAGGVLDRDAGLTPDSVPAGGDASDASVALGADASDGATAVPDAAAVDGAASDAGMGADAGAGAGRDAGTVAPCAGASALGVCWYLGATSQDL